MTLHCRDDSVIKESHRANQVYQHQNRSTPNLLTEQQSLPQHASSSNAFRSPLHNLLPRHAYFRARVTIHKVTNIPLVSGTFSARWKFKNVHSAPGTKRKLLGMVKGRSRPGTPLTQLEFPKEGKAKNKDDGLESDDSTISSSHTDTAVPAVVVSSFGRSDPPPNVFSARTENNSRFRRLVSPTSATTPRTAVAYPAFSPDVDLAGFSPAGFTGFTVPLHPDFASPIQPLHAKSPNSMFSPGFSIPTVRINTLSSMLTAKPDQRDVTSPARGQTPTAELKDHTVVWNHIVNTVLRIDVSRDSGILAISPLKLIIVQHSAKNDNSNAPQKSKLGVMYLNMSEYVDKGLVERKYLLRESKTNAIMKVRHSLVPSMSRLTSFKLTIELEHIGGDASYVAPALPRGEIMNGITSLLEKDLYRAGLDKSKCPEKGAIPASRQVSQSSGPAVDHALGGHLSNDPRLPGASGAKNTEALIDALFNPAITREREKESPFTVYVPPEQVELASLHDHVDANPRKLSQNLEVASMYSTSSSNDDTWTTARTVSSHSSVSRSDTSSSSKSSKIRKLHLHLGPSRHEISQVEQPLSSAQNVKGWWKRRIASRPATPTFA